MRRTALRWPGRLRSSRCSGVTRSMRRSRNSAFSRRRHKPQPRASRNRPPCPRKARRKCRAAQPAQPAPPPKKEGFFDALGQWWDQSAADFDANLKKMKSSDRRGQRAQRQGRARGDARCRHRDQGSDRRACRNCRPRASSRASERCALAPNGSPDCGPAAEAICKAKGFKTGQSANIESARKCSARALLTRNEQDCTNETIVTRAACQ